NQPDSPFQPVHLQNFGHEQSAQQTVGHNPDASVHVPNVADGTSSLPSGFSPMNDGSVFTGSSSANPPSAEQTAPLNADHSFDPGVPAHGTFAQNHSGFTTASGAHQADTAQFDSTSNSGESRTTHGDHGSSVPPAEVSHQSDFQPQPLQAHEQTHQAWQQSQSTDAQQQPQTADTTDNVPARHQHQSAESHDSFVQHTTSHHHHSHVENQPHMQDAQQHQHHNLHHHHDNVEQPAQDHVASSNEGSHIAPTHHETFIHSQHQPEAQQPVEAAAQTDPFNINNLPERRPDPIIADDFVPTVTYTSQEATHIPHEPAIASRPTVVDSDINTSTAAQDPFLPNNDLTLQQQQQQQQQNDLMLQQQQQQDLALQQQQQDLALQQQREQQQLQQQQDDYNAMARRMAEETAREIEQARLQDLGARQSDDYAPSRPDVVDSGISNMENERTEQEQQQKRDEYKEEETRKE
ncbi:MAG: hypothetical protein ACRD3W_16630, partial [Terriglobales bacterium]